MSEKTQHKRGFVRADGLLFWHRNGKYERWVTPEEFERSKQMTREVAARQYARNKRLAPNNPTKPTRLDEAIRKALEVGDPRRVLASLDRGRAEALAKIRAWIAELPAEDRSAILDKPGTPCDIDPAP